tara:strand:- start:1466 stop:1654 length:189 start_codon:yes stop_codon:yes gene_type:complete
MKQIDLIVNKVPIVLDVDEDNWTKNNLIVLKPDAKEYEVIDIINYLFEEGFILDRRIKYKIV